MGDPADGACSWSWSGTLRERSLPGTDLVATPLGFGCASLGSRYDRRVGLRALAAAHERGVTWFDVAPAYGAGSAETILGEFLRSRRDQVQVCTKIGLAPPRRSLARRALMPVARPLLARAKRVRALVRGSGATANVRIPLTPELIETSLSRSLARLGTDRVDVCALHDPAPEDIVRDDVLRALERVVERGQARYVAVAGDLGAGIAGAAAGRYRVIQLADGPTMTPLDRVRGAATTPLTLVSHSILGIGGAQGLLVQRLIEEPAALARARDAGFGETPQAVAAALLMARAFAANPQGVVLASMFGAGHLASNVSAAELSAERARIAEVIVARCLADDLPDGAIS